MIPLFPLPVFGWIISPALWSISPFIMGLAVLFYFSTTLPRFCHSRWGDSYYRYCNYSRPVSLVLLWIGWSFSLSLPQGYCKVPLFAHFTLYHAFAGWSLSLISFLIYAFSVKALGLRLSFCYRRTDDQVVDSSIYRYLHHPQYWSSSGMVAGVVIAENYLPGAVLLLSFCLMLVAGADWEERDMAGKEPPFSLWSVLTGIAGMAGILFQGSVHYGEVWPLISPERFGLAGDEILQCIVLLLIVIAIPLSLVAIFAFLIRKEGKKALLFLNMFIILGILQFFVDIMWGGFRDARNQGNYSMCKSNEASIAKALDNYASMRGGKYPDKLESIVPECIPSLPVCPASKRETYSAGYQVSDDRRAFTIRCRGANHYFWKDFKKVCLEGDYPAYDSRKGSIEAFNYRTVVDW